MTKKFLTLTGISLLVFLCVCWSLVLNAYNAIWIESIVGFGLTFYALQKYNGKLRLSLPLSVIAILLGRIILEIPIRICDWAESIGSLSFTLASICAILLGALCYKSNKIYTFIFAFIVMIAINTLSLFYLNKLPI